MADHSELSGARRIVLATFGSLGDLHPFLALARGLKDRGYSITLAAASVYQSRIEGEGILFRRLRPNLPPPHEAPDILRRAMDTRAGTEYLVRDLILPGLREGYLDLLEAVCNADLLVTHPVTFAGPLVAEVTGIPWVSTVLSPLSFFSLHEDLTLSNVPWLRRLRRPAPALYRALINYGKGQGMKWTEPIRKFRQELGLRPGQNPLFEGQHSPGLVLALFSPLFGVPQMDWPPQARATGFLFFDRFDGIGLSPSLEAFLSCGTPPVVFTLGSAAVGDPGEFYLESVRAAQSLGVRAVLLTGHDPRNIPANLPPGVVAFPYAPFSELFQLASVVVHQGGIGTTAQALRAGKPMLVMPYSHDQPDNARRIANMGVGLVISRERYRADRAARALAWLLRESPFKDRASAIGQKIRSEDGLSAACDAIEEYLQNAAPSPNSRLSDAVVPDKPPGD